MFVCFIDHLVMACGCNYPCIAELFVKVRWVRVGVVYVQPRLSFSVGLNQTTYVKYGLALHINFSFEPPINNQDTFGSAVET